MLTDPTIINPPRGERGRAIATVAVAAVGAAALAFAFDHRGAMRRAAPAVVAAPPVRAVAKAPAIPAWAFDHCPALVAAPPSPLDAIARAQAAFAPARDPALRGVSLDAPVIATWTDRRVWLSVDGGASWGRVLDGPGRVASVHADRCGRVVVVRAPAQGALVLGTRIEAHEQWRALPAAAGGAFLGLDASDAHVAIAARAIAAPGRDPDDAIASIVTTDDRGARWTAPLALGDVAAASPLYGRGGLSARIAPRGCPNAGPCAEIVSAAGARDRYASAVELIDDPTYSKRWIFAPAAACGGALACWAFEGEPLVPVELAADPPAIARFVVSAQHVVFAIPVDADRDLLSIRAGEARPVIGSAGFPAEAVDSYDGLFGIRGAELLRLGVSAGVTTMFHVPGAAVPVALVAPAPAVPGADAACPAATAIRTAARHDQYWLVPMAVIANDKLGLDGERDLDVGAESHADDRVRLVDAARARAAGAPPLPRSIWILGSGERASCHAVVRGYYAAGDDLSQDSTVGAVVAGCDGAELAGFAAIDADAGACKVAAIAPATPAQLPSELAAQADGAYTPDDPRGNGSPTYVAYSVRVPDDGRGYAHVAVDDGGDPIAEGNDPRTSSSTGWQWIEDDGTTTARPEVADDFSEAITALLYDASGPRYAFIDGDCRWSLASIGAHGALTGRASRHLERGTCNREHNPPAAWLSPHAGDMLGTL